MTLPTGHQRREIAGRSIRWNAAMAADAYAQGWWCRDTLADALARALDAMPDRVVVVDGQTRLDIRTLHDHAARVAAALMDRFPPGQVVSFMLPNWHEAAAIYLGITLAGMVAHPLPPALRDADLSFLLRDSESRLVFIPARLRDFDYRAMLARVASALPKPPEVVVLRGDAGGHTPYQSLLTTVGQRSFPRLDPDAVRMILYTSGTTGRPKGVMHSHNSIHALIRQIGRHWRVEAGDTFLVPSPISHIGGSIYAFECPLLLGTRAVLMDQWDGDAALGLMRAEGCTHMAGATPFLDHLVAAARRAGEVLPHLKVFICGGAAVPPALIRAAADQFRSAMVTRVYGSTEVPVTTVGATARGDLSHAADTDGRAGIADVRLYAHDGQSAGEVGEVRARGPQMLVGYHRADDEDGAFDDDGYFRTGDLARRIPGGYLVITGRIKDIIIRNGENISAKDVEDLLAGHPMVREIAIVGLPDPRTGERACAVVVPAWAPGPDVASLRAFLEARGVARFKIPERVVVWDALPRNEVGKVLKQTIRDVLMETVTPR
ncbi:AMP-binding protein [Nitrospirillum iridis]|uniref:Acyl-CoA synthetase (AMP-forming)/AMP-acid ligase II n=1 Tax=Nitrospirillum iridis TaxID=765888 RepID=A0A7X0B031_9PROT|nr:AMP-binding protein [Nitrospirillum iridis]MBB6253294.1 acyl-CoA synthetase (AMP-forming)/AMP-acid ligase II [Nitrospirillum iridis]